MPGRLAEFARVHLTLARASNLPTVWSNCLAAGALATIGFLPTLPVMMISMSLLYIGGMYLNDACDAEIDAAYLKNRPIPMGRISRATVYICGFAFLALGLALVLGEGLAPFVSASALVAAIILYDLAHTRLRWSPLLLGLCRALVYITVGLAARREFEWRLYVWALALAAYVTGFSYVAKAEETNLMRRYAPLMLLFVPPALALIYSRTASQYALCILFVAYVGLCLFFVLLPRRRQLRLAVTGLIAGISLVDLLGASLVIDNDVWLILIFLMFALTHVFQRFIPAT